MIYFILGAIVYFVPNLWVNYTLNKHNDILPNMPFSAKEFGEDQVQIWRRSYDIPPPGGESLKMTCDRTLPYFEKILDLVLENNNIIIAAHGNSIRAIVKKIFNYSSSLILKTEVGWCEPWILTFEGSDLVGFKILTRGSDDSMSSLPIKLDFHCEN